MSFRYALKPYIINPSQFPDIVVYEDAEFIVIKDQFPKALFHYLVIPKDLNISNKNPLTVFEDNEELKKKAQNIIEYFTQEILEDFENTYKIKPPSDFVRAGVHAVPSMANLHIHIISQDFNSVRLKNKVHYNSFTTDFFVPFEDLPLKPGDKRLDHQTMELLTKKSDLHCVYCSRNFSNKFAELKRHLTEEFKTKYLQ